MAHVLVQYPSGPSFDLDYYLKTHMPLVEKTWKPVGLISYEITVFNANEHFQVQASLRWESVEAFQAASAAEGAKAVFGDIPNFTEAKPVLLVGNITASSA